MATRPVASIAPRHEVKLWPLQITEAQYYTRDLASLDVPPGLSAKAGLRIRFQSTAGKMLSELKLDRLTLFLRGPDETPYRLYEQCFAKGCGVLVQPATRPVTQREVLGPEAIRRVGFDDGQRLLPFDARSFHGYRLLQEYFAFPQRFLFVELAGLAPAVRQCKQNALDVVVLFREPNLDLENNVQPDNFGLFCSPAANLFPKRADRIQVSDRFSEFHVVPDRTRPRDFEVYQVTSVTGLGARSGEERAFRPFYSATDVEADAAQPAAYFQVNRVPRALSEREKQVGRRSSYPGSEVYISLVDAHQAPYSTELQQLAITTLCTNRDLPLFMPVGRGRTDFDMEKSGPVASVRCLTSPTKPAALLRRGRDGLAADQPFVAELPFVDRHRSPAGGRRVAGIAEAVRRHGRAAHSQAGGRPEIHYQPPHRPPGSHPGADRVRARAGSWVSASTRRLSRAPACSCWGPCWSGSSPSTSR